MVLGRDLTGQCMIRSCIVDHGSAIIVKLKGTIPDKSTETGVKKKKYFMTWKLTGFLKIQIKLRHIKMFKTI